MPKLSFSFNEDTGCTQIETYLDFEIQKSNLIVKIIKCYNPDDQLDDVLEFDALDLVFYVVLRVLLY